MQATFGKPIGLLVIEIRFGKQLPGEKTRAVEALETGASGAATLLGMSRHRRRGWRDPYIPGGHWSSCSSKDFLNWWFCSRRH